MDMVAVEPAGQFSGHLIAFATMLVAFRFFEITNADGTFCPTVVCVLMQLTNQFTMLLSITGFTMGMAFHRCIAGILMPVLCYFR